MKANYTHILYILDRSGSMASVAGDVQRGFDSFIQSQKELPGECTFSLIQFDNDYEEHYHFASIKMVRTFVFMPRGSTALYDAIGRAINETGKSLELMPSFARPEKVLVIIHTDGEENSSEEFTKAQIAEMIKHQEEKYSWKFSFIGTNFDVMGEGSDLKIKAGNTLAYQNNSRGIKNMYDTVRGAVSNYRAASVEVAATMDMFPIQPTDNTEIKTDDKT